MKPLVLEYFESKNDNNISATTTIEYSDKLNLCVIKGTDDPAIEISNMDTGTFIKGENGGSDTDRDLNTIKNLLDTATSTRAKSEVSDSDVDNQIMQKLFDTRTLTESRESTDQDK